MKVDCIGLNCSECCRRYWITVLPAELKKQARLMHLSEKKFIEKYCVLHLNLFPVTVPGKSLVVPSVFLPKKIASRLKRHFEPLPSHFIALPSIAFKRGKKGACIFLSNNLCKIYSARPRQCALFPFISIEKTDLALEYPFCPALKQKRMPAKKLLEKAQLLNVSRYFESVAKKGFEKVWPALPSKAVLCLENNFLCGISKKDFLKILEFI
ncbi:MAG: YkgJ family cysteine cluster protein, partial [Candidatus ainarchaeum sp.]|nr:YkgJ family cysteine cluster protein [Candidatus ainarchaeum sp.]